MTARRTYAALVPTLAAVVVIVVALLVKTGTPAPARPLTAAGVAPVASGHTTVIISNYAYSPDHLTVKVGTRVTWTNRDSTAHTVTANNNTSFNTGTINPRQSRTVVFGKVGTFPYHCLFHAFMNGTVTVVS
jgi:plastocyanin